MPRQWFTSDCAELFGVLRGPKRQLRAETIIGREIRRGKSRRSLPV